MKSVTSTSKLSGVGYKPTGCRMQVDFSLYTSNMYTWLFPNFEQVTSFYDILYNSLQVIEKNVIRLE